MEKKYDPTQPRATDGTWRGGTDWGRGRSLIRDDEAVVELEGEDEPLLISDDPEFLEKFADIVDEAVRSHEDFDWDEDDEDIDAGEIYNVNDDDEDGELPAVGHYASGEINITYGGRSIDLDADEGNALAASLRGLARKLTSARHAEEDRHDEMRSRMFAILDLALEDTEEDRAWRLAQRRRHEMDVATRRAARPVVDDDLDKALDGDHDGSQLKHYWTKDPKGLAKWRDSPHPWTALYHHLRKYMPSAKAKRTAASWFHEVTGMWPGERKGDNPVGPG